MWHEKRVRIKLPPSTELPLADLDGLLDHAVERIPRSGKAYRAEVVDGSLHVVFRVLARIEPPPEEPEKNPNRKSED